MYHSLIFTKDEQVINTWEDWHLIPASRPVVTMPQYTSKYVDIPGMDGSLDLTDYLVGRPTYSDRSGSFTFYVENDNGYWEDRRAEIAAFMDGSKMQMQLEDDIAYYYIGRFWMSGWSTGDSHSQVTIDYRVEPYKYRISDGKAVL